MTKSALTTGVQTTTAAGALTPTAGLDISAMTLEPTLKIRVTALTDAKKATIALEDSVNAFTASVVRAAFNIVGGPPTGSDRVLTVSKQDLANLRRTTSGVARINVTAIDASTSLSLEAWFET